MKGVVYYLPGYGGSLSTGLGEGLMDRGWHVTGRETTGEFRDLPFTQQVETIAADLHEHFWREDAHVVAVSFGAYLFLHAQAQLAPFIGRVLLLSPIVGSFSNQDTGTFFEPPQAGRLRELAQAGQFAAPRHCEIHVGAEDWQSRPGDVTDFARQTGIPVTVVPGTGHMLGKRYVGPVLDTWLGSPATLASGRQALH